MNRRLTIVFPLLLVLLAAGSPAHAATAIGRAHGFAPHEVIVKFKGEPRGRARSLPQGTGVLATARALRQNPAVDYAAPDYMATASGIVESEVPNDPGTLTGLPGVPGGWVTKQWNFLPWEGPGSPLAPISPGGIDAIGAWENLVAAKQPGAKGVTVAVLDTGIAYRSRGKRFRRSPDFGAGQFVKGYDFVAHNHFPLDRNGHGTHVAGTIAEKTNNGIGLTGLAYRAKLMPVRVLDRFGRGRADQITEGIRFAVAHHADVINMSFNFGCGKKVPSVVEALHYAARKGLVLVASAGNLGSEGCVSPPATVSGVIGVGGTTEGGCLGEYSLAGKDIDVVAPGGGEPVAGCESVLNAPIYQVTFKGNKENRFAEPSTYVGTSMAAAHVSGVAAMVLASGVIDRSKKGGSIEAQVATRLKKTARSIGLSPLQQGAGLIDAAQATDPSCQLACFSNRR
ncbi:MAG: S8 family serine peptidase [Solirubrobacterales bacterium]